MYTFSRELPSLSSESLFTSHSECIDDLLVMIQPTIEVKREKRVKNISLANKQIELENLKIITDLEALNNLLKASIAVVRMLKLRFEIKLGLHSQSQSTSSAYARTATNTLYCSTALLKIVSTHSSNIQSIFISSLPLSIPVVPSTYFATCILPWDY